VVVSAGANILVAGSAVFGHEDRTAAMESIRASVTTLKV
jgi:pentose-5-phosphate-3-epimerase